MDNGLLGSAKFSTFGGHTKEALINGANIVIGRSAENGCGHLWHGKRPDKHFVSVAPTRSGKGAALIIPNLLNYRGSSIVIDPKGENAFVTAPWRREKGHSVHILDPWGEVNRRYGATSGVKEEIATFNPLSILDPASEHFADDIAYIADSVIINQGKDPHWDDSARELVAGLIAYAVIKFGDAASLPLVRLLLTKPADQIAGIAEEAQEFGAFNVAARKLGRFTSESKEIGSIISTALTQTAFLDSETLGKNLEKSSFAFSELTEGEATIYLVLPVDKLQTYGRWLRLMVSIGIRTIARNTRRIHQGPVMFYLDEFGTIGKLSAVSQAVGLMAGLQMCIWVFVQDFIQLKRDYPNEWETFIANAGAVTAFNVMDQFTAEYISKMLGQTTVERISQATAEKRKGGFFGGGDPNYMSMADQEFSRALVNPDEVRRLLQDRGFFIVAGDNPIIFKKANYYEEDFLLEICRANPLFPNPLVKKNEDFINQYLQEKAAIEKRYPEAMPDKIGKQMAHLEGKFLEGSPLKYLRGWFQQLKEIVEKERSETMKKKAKETAFSLGKKGIGFFSRGKSNTIFEDLERDKRPEHEKRKEVVVKAFVPDFKKAVKLIEMNPKNKVHYMSDRFGERYKIDIESKSIYERDEQGVILYAREILLQGYKNNLATWNNHEAQVIKMGLLQAEG